MRVLVACEFSGVVRDAFLAAGHDAISCDLLPTESPGPHVQGNVMELLREPWDLVVAHPPCTYLSPARGRFRDLDKVGEAMDFFIDCLGANAPMVAVENPLPYRLVRLYLGEPDCIVQPWQFGDMYLKRTGLWLRNLPPLLPTMMADDSRLPTWVQGKRPNRQNRRDGFHRSSKKRAEFHPGMAAAMARQWGR